MEQFIKSLEWHHLAFLFALVFIIVFRASIAGLISRITAIDKSGVKTTSEPNVQREEKKQEAVQELIASIGESVVLADIEGRIKTELEAKGLETEGDTIKVLIKHLAASRILTEFEQIYNLIFGSQIFLLKKLNEVAGQGRSEEYVRKHFEHVKELFPDELGAWDVEQYLEFLLGRSLITKHGSNYHITNLGVEFLTWMARNGRSENRAL